MELNELMKVSRSRDHSASIINKVFETHQNKYKILTCTNRQGAMLPPITNCRLGLKKDKFLQHQMAEEHNSKL